MILGPTGKNFGAGMSGGVAYVYDPDRRFAGLCNVDVAQDLFAVDDGKVGPLGAEGGMGCVTVGLGRRRGERGMQQQSPI